MTAWTKEDRAKLQSLAQRWRLWDYAISAGEQDLLDRLTASHEVLEARVVELEKAGRLDLAEANEVVEHLEDKLAKLRTACGEATKELRGHLDSTLCINWPVVVADIAARLEKEAGAK